MTRAACRAGRKGASPGLSLRLATGSFACLVAVVAASVAVSSPAATDVQVNAPDAPAYRLRVPDQPALALGFLGRIAVGPDGRVWASSPATGHTLGFDPADPGDEDSERSVLTGRVDDLAVARDGHLVALRQAPPRLLRMTEDGTVIASITTIGPGAGQLGFDGPRQRGPEGLAPDPRTGDVLVADTQNHRVQRFGPDGTFVDAWGSFGSEPGNFFFPYSVAVTPDGDVFVSDRPNETGPRVQRFGPTGELLDSWPLVIPEISPFPINCRLTADPSGDLWCGIHGGTLARFDREGEVETVVESYDLSDVGESRVSRPGDVAPAPDGTLFVTDGGTSMSGFGRLLQTDAEGTVLAIFGTSGRSDDRFVLPRGLTVNPATGTVSVLDTLGTVRQFDHEGRFLRRFGALGAGPGQFAQGTAASPMAADPSNGDLYVTDRSAGRIHVFDSEGRFVRTIGTLGNGAGQLLDPAGIALDANGILYVADRGRGDIQRFAADGTVLEPIVEPGSLDQPGALAFLPNGNLLVAVAEFPRRLVELTPAGERVGEVFTGSGFPAGVTVSPAGDRYLLFANSSQLVLRRGHDDAFIPWSFAGPLAGQQGQPIALALDHERRQIWVADQAFHRIQAFRTPDTTPPVITVSSPAPDATYALGEPAVMEFTCTDDESGIARCDSGPAPSGSPLDTSRIGEFSLQVSARDGVGNAATSIVHYRVVYDFSGFLPPVVDDEQAATRVQAGRVLPVRFRLPGFEPAPTAYALGAVTPGFPVSREVPCGGHVEPTDTSGVPTNPGSTEVVRYEADNGTLVYEWQTDPAWAGTCRVFVLRLPDGTSHSFLADFRNRS